MKTSKLEKWIGYEFSTGSDTGSDYLKFQREARSDLKKMAEENGLKLHSFSKNHYCFSAVLKNELTGNYIYVSISDVRFFSSRWFYDILYRTMSHEKDWTGGHNMYCCWKDVGEKAKRLSERG
ncbi:hypothetical protein M2146_002539 [Lachnospiraceae bacterium PF1-22]